MIKIPKNKYEAEALARNVKLIEIEKNQWIPAPFKCRRPYKY